MKIQEVTIEGYQSHTNSKDGNSLNLTRDNLINLPIGESYIPVEPTGPEYADMVKGVHYRKDKQR